MYLEKFTPAEILLLTKGKSADYKTLLKCTLLHLLLKRVLKTTTETKQPHPNDPLQTYNYIAIGENFNSYKAVRHEEVFLSYFNKDKTAQVLFKNLVKIAYQKSVVGSYYQALTIRNERMKPLYTENFLQKIFGGFTITTAGIDAQKVVNDEIKAQETQLNKAKSDEERLRILAPLFGCAFLFYNIAPELTQQIDTMLLQQAVMFDNTGTTGCSTWGSFDHYSSDFDSGCGSDGGSGDGGGDSGCSGCSGCGGGD